ncbi:MAG: hypothetical protein ACK46Q_10165 [Hyphomonas sp.]
MNETLDRIPPEAWPIIDILFNVTMAAAGIWLAITVFVVWRRHSSNLTPVHAASRSRKAQPDFLKVDHKARAAAIKRGEAHEAGLDMRDAEEAKAEAAAAAAAAAAAKVKEPATFAQRIAGLVTFLMSLFTLISIIVSSVFTITRMGDYVGEYTAWERFTAIILQHPIAFTICLLIILARIYTQFFPSAKKEG